MPEDARLLEVASVVAEPAEIDWNEVDRNCGSDRERSVVRELRLLADIARAVRNPPEASPSAASTGPHTVPDVERWGHLTVRAETGRGSFGVVYRAWDPKLQSEVALKLVKRSVASTFMAGSRALNEARLLARVRHENVVTVYGADCHDERFGLWMKLVRGRTLQQVLEVQGPMGDRETTLVGLDLCHALAAVHGAGLVHRDLKATNVMREEGGRILLMDFGAGHRLPAIDEPVVGLVGTPLYLAPELFLGDNPSPASDIYSLGVLLYYLLPGSYPIQENSREGIERAHKQNQRRLLRDARPDLPSAFIDVIERALSPHPTKRYATAGEFGNALAAVAGRRFAPDDNLRPPSRPIPWKTITAAAATAIVVLAAAAKLGRAPDRPSESLNATPRQAAEEVAPFAPPPTPAPAPYRIEASFYAIRNDERVRLMDGSRVGPGDRLFLTLDASRPVFVYLINQDDQRGVYVQFPLPGQQLTNPVPVGTHQLPGPREGMEHYWEVTTAGGREHFLVYVSPDRLADLEQLWVSLPRAEVGRPVQTEQRLAANALGVLRSVGGLTSGRPSQRSTPGGLADLPRLPQGSEAARGVWARQITFDNPTK
jgi:serine/threonine-protein kinase